jgi:ubiquitin C-terminal hydrolase
MGGHYYACVKNANNKWYKFNDARVSEISEAQLKTPYAYCFFYRKKK